MVQYAFSARSRATSSLDGLLTKLKEAGISAGLRVLHMRVVSPAMVPTCPRAPPNPHIAFLSNGLGSAHWFGPSSAITGQHREKDARTTSSPRYAYTVPRRRPPRSAKPMATAAPPNYLRAPPATVTTSALTRRQRSHRNRNVQTFAALRRPLSSVLLTADHPPNQPGNQALRARAKPLRRRQLAVTLAQLGESRTCHRCRFAQARPSAARLLSLRAASPPASVPSRRSSSLDLGTIQHPAIPNLSAMSTPARSRPIPPTTLFAQARRRHRRLFATKFKFLFTIRRPRMAATDARDSSSVKSRCVFLLVVRKRRTPKEAFNLTRDSARNVNAAFSSASV